MTSELNSKFEGRNANDLTLTLTLSHRMGEGIGFSFCTLARLQEREG
jgi:hypothetical protein